MLTINNALIPVDFSACSEQALERARALTEQCPHATLHLLHVVTEPLHDVWTSFAPGADAVRRIRECEAEALTRLAAMRTPAECHDHRVVMATALGEPADEILRYAVAHGIDLIVCGTHQREGWPRFLMGSVAERIVRNAKCPVITVAGHEGAVDAA